MSIPKASHLSSPPPIAQLNDDEERINMALDRYKERIAVLPKEKGWMTKDLYMYQGFWHQSGPINSIEALMAIQDTLKALPSDIYLATTPKSGTTWLKALVYALVKRNRCKNYNLATHPLLVSNPHACVPDITVGIFRNPSLYTNGDSPRLFSTHIPFTSLPQSILDSSCRVVYLRRNQKDVFVSLFYFANRLRDVRDKSLGLMKFEEEFKLFTKGITPHGPYWDHVRGYRKFSLEHPEKVLFLTYEEMTFDTTNIVKRLAEFLGYPFTEEEEVEGAVHEIVRLCSFKNLSEVNKHGNLVKGLPNDSFFREGKVGDWKNHLTDERSHILDEITQEKFHGLDISFPN